MFLERTRNSTFGQHRLSGTRMKHKVVQIIAWCVFQVVRLQTRVSWSAQSTSWNDLWKRFSGDNRAIRQIHEYSLRLGGRKRGIEA